MKRLSMIGILALAVLVTSYSNNALAEKKTILEVTKWGPQSANVGTVPNKQPNGSMGIWIQASKTQGLGKLQVLFDGQAVKSAVREKIIIAAIPSEQIAKPGNKGVVIKQTKTGKVFPVGTFVVKPIK